jgi:hypothetical protein
VEKLQMEQYPTADAEIQPSGFAAKKQTIFRQTSLLFEGDAAHRLKKEAQDDGKAAFFAQNVNGLDSYIKPNAIKYLSAELIFGIQTYRRRCGKARG